MSQFLGLILLLLGMGSFFVLWLMKLNNRSKVVETQISEPEPVKPAGRFSSASPYSLSPSQAANGAQASREPAGEAFAPQPQCTQHTAQQLAQDEPRVALDPDDPTASTHLEIASHFFDMGDFAGAVDMCQLVMDNKAASPSQKEAANALKGRCG